MGELRAKRVPHRRRRGRAWSGRVRTFIFLRRKRVISSADVHSTLSAVCAWERSSSMHRQMRYGVRICTQRALLGVTQRRLPRARCRRRRWAQSFVPD